MNDNRINDEFDTASCVLPVLNSSGYPRHSLLICTRLELCDEFE
jgi:hypothetical protein